MNMRRYAFLNTIALTLLVVFVSYGAALRTNGTCYWSPTIENCRSYEFQCLSGQCISGSRYCDGSYDCGDGSDEKYCFPSGYPEKCRVDPPFIRCQSQNRCIPQRWFCNGIHDCYLGEDEKFCEKAKKSNVSGAVLGAVEWFHNQKKLDSYTEVWGPLVHKSAVALFLGDRNFSSISTSMAYEVSIQLLSQLSRKKLRDIPTNRLASFVNAFLVSCLNPRKFHGLDIIQELRTRVNEQNYTDPYVLLSLCNAGEIITESDKMKLFDTFWNERRIFWTDMQAIVIMALSCAAKQPGNEVDSQAFRELIVELKKRQYRNGTVENPQTTALVMQALLSTEIDGAADSFDEKKALEQIVLSQKEDGSFGNLMTTYYILPVLTCRSLVNISSDHCQFGRKDEISALQNLANQSGPKIRIQYSLWLGNDKDLERNLVLRVPGNISFYGVMEIAAEVDSRYRFEYVVKNRKPYINAISGLQDDPDNGKFWFLYIVKDKKPVPAQDSPADVMPKDHDHFVMWYRQGSWID